MEYFKRFFTRNESVALFAIPKIFTGVIIIRDHNDSVNRLTDMNRLIDRIILIF
jgi:transposase